MASPQLGNNFPFTFGVTGGIIDLYYQLLLIMGLHMDLNRLETYREDVCWQYTQRMRNYDADLQLHNLTEEYTKSLRVSDFEFKNVTDKIEQKKCVEFIKIYEWMTSPADEVIKKISNQ